VRKHRAWLVKVIRLGYNASMTTISKGAFVRNHLVGMRRRDREQNDAWIASFLDKADYGVLAVCDGGQPFTVARNFVYDSEKHVVYFHGARKGRTFEYAESGALANLNVSVMGEWIIAERAMNFGVKYRGAVLFGKLALVESADEAKRALQQLMDKYFPALKPDKDYVAATDVDLKVTAVIRLDIDAWSGKEKKS
jgi:nitroimidazol reductase NimA-like FMN-containing flavoprotein (pyridoxamine 5'-phosphate oxidase superfamily)